MLLIKCMSSTIQSLDIFGSGIWPIICISPALSLSSLFGDIASGLTWVTQEILSSYSKVGN